MVRLITALFLAVGLVTVSGGRVSDASTTIAPAVSILCGVKNPADVEFNPPAATPATEVAANSNIYGYAIGNSDIYVVGGNGTMTVYDMTGAEVTSWALPADNFTPYVSLYIGTDGNIYIASGSGVVYKITPTGSVVWSYQFSGSGISNIYPWQGAVAVVLSSSGALLSDDGVLIGSSPIASNGSSKYVTPLSNGGLLVDDQKYVYTYNSSGVQTSYFGNSKNAFTGDPTANGAPLSFQAPSYAIEVGSSIYVADTDTGIDVFNPQGVYEGHADTEHLGTGVRLPSQLYQANGDLYFIGNGGIYSISLTNLASLASAPGTLLDTDGFAESLGMGAGLTTPATDNYFPAGITPTVNATFDPWWTTAPATNLSYQVADSTQVTSNDWPAATVVSATNQALTIPAADQGPGVYEVNADLIQGDATIGATCLTYSVGAPGDTLNFGTLASGSDYGGPAPVRAVELASELGPNMARSPNTNMTALLPNCNPNSTTAATCGPSGLSYSSLDPVTEQAASEAKSLGAVYDLQIATGSAVDHAVVSNGYWQADIQAIAEHLATSAPDLVYLEPWNEPNNTGLSPSTYVSQVLAPFYAAVQAANTATGSHFLVIGGSAELGSYWNGIQSAGGFADMNVIGIHPYTGFDDSYEEDATVPAIQAIMNMAPGMPVFDTEQGWWSDGFEAFYDAGNWAARGYLWNKSLGIDNWDYFITEGGFSGTLTSYSLVQGSDYVKPDGIALMTAARLVGNRPYLGSVTTGIPHTYGMLFGGTSNHVEVLWTDDFPITAKIKGTKKASLATTGDLGATGKQKVAKTKWHNISLSGAPIYLTVPLHQTLTVAPTTPFGPDLALGGTATSSNGGNASAVIRSGPDATDDNGANYFGWAGAPGDSVTVSFPATSISRVLVSTATLGSVNPGLRGYQLQLDENGTWITIPSQDNEFYNRMAFAGVGPVTASGVRLIVQSIDQSGSAGGPRPWWWGSSTDPGPTMASVYSVEVYK